eukprot:gene14321-16455_t
MVKLSFITLLAVVSLGALFMLALLWVHGSSRYNDGKDVHYHPKKFYDVYAQEDPALIQKDRIFASKKESKMNSSAQSSPTEQPMTIAEEYPAHSTVDEDSKSKVENQGSETDHIRDSQDKTIEDNASEIKLPELNAAIEDYSNLSVSASVPEDVKNAVQGETSEVVKEDSVVQAPPLELEPIQAVAAPTEPPLPPLYHNTFVVSPDSEAPLFSALHSAYAASIQQQVDKARKLAALIFPVISDTVLSASSFEFHALERLHRALKTGANCVAPLAITAELDDPTVYASIQALLENTDESFNQGLKYHPKSIIEYTKSSVTPGLTVSTALASLYPTITVLQLQFDTGNGPDEPDMHNNNNNRYASRKSSLCPMERAGSNVYVASGESTILDRTPLTLDCVQIVPDLDLLVGNLLPFELEELLGNVLCRCNVTYVPSVLPNNAYFAFWESAAHLLHSAARAIPDSCELSFDSNSLLKFVSTVKSSHIVVQRNISDSAASPSAEKSGSTSSSWSSSSFSSSYRTSSAYSSETKAVAAGPTAEDVAKTFLSVNLLSRLGLDARSRHHLWSSVLTYLASAPGEIYQKTANASVLELLVQGSSVRSAVDVVTKAPRRSYLAEHEERSALLQPVAATVATDARGASPQRSVMNSAEPAPVVPLAPVVIADAAVEVPSSARAVLADSNFTLTAPISAPIMSIDNTSVAPSVVSLLSTTTNTTSSSKGAPSRRRRLYDVVKRGTTTSSTTSSNRHSSSSSSGSSTQADVFHEESQTLTWEFPDRAASIQSGAEEFDETDYVIKNQLHLQLNSAGSDSSASSSRINGQYSRKYSVSKESRGLQRHLHLREDDTFQKWMAVLKIPMAASEDRIARSGLSIIAESGLVYVMGRHISLLSLKLAKMLSSKSQAHQGVAQSSGVGGGLLVSLLSDSLSFRSHSILNQMMDLKNNVICRPVWSPATLAALLVSPERASLSIVQVDVVVEVIVGALYTTAADAQAMLLSEPVHVETECKAALLEESLAALLSMAEVSLIEVPSDELLRVLFAESGLPSACVDALAQRYVSGAQLLELSMQQLHLGASVEISELPTSADPFVQAKNQVKMFRVDMQRLPSLSEDTQAVQGYKFVNKASHVGLSVYTALQLGIVNAQKKTLLKMLIDFPLWKFKPSMEISPWDLFIRLTASSPKRSRASWSLFYSASEQHAGRKDAHGIDAVSRNHMHYTADLRSEHSDDLSVGVSVRAGSAQSDRVQGRAVWKALEYELSAHGAELAEGRFSFVEHDSGFGYVSLRVAKAFPNATVISLERSAPKVAHHVAMVKALFADNNAVCLKAEPDATIFRNVYESPELFRFQLQSRSMLDGFIEADSLIEWGSMVGTMLSAALTTFVYAPSSAQVSWAMHVLFSEVYDFQRAEGTVAAHFRRYNLPAPVRALSDMFGPSFERLQSNIEPVLELNKLSHHPQYPYRDFEKQWVLENARVNGGDTAIQLSPLAARDKLSDTSKDAQRGGYSIPLVRCDIVNMTRHVHHHYDYSKDGHSRTYTMRVKVNQTLSDLVMGHIGDPSQALAAASPHGIVLNTATHSSMYALEHQLSAGEEGAAVDSGGLLLPLGYHPNQHSIVGVHLFRDRDTFPIPYTHIYGVTLISALRLGLEHTLRDRLFKHFLKMPLYEDM